MLYLYGEASPILKLAMDHAVQEDPVFRKELRLLKRTCRQLEQLKKKAASPRASSVDAVLQYARKKSSR